MIKKNILPLLFVGILLCIPIFLGQESSVGTDNLAQARIVADNPNYKPWFEPLFVPNAIMENLIFTLQACLGTGLIGFLVGLKVGAQRQRKSIRAD